MTDSAISNHWVGMEAATKALLLQIQKVEHLLKGGKYGHDWNDLVEGVSEGAIIFRSIPVLAVKFNELNEQKELETRELESLKNEKGRLTSEIAELREEKDQLVRREQAAAKRETDVELQAEELHRREQALGTRQTDINRQAERVEGDRKLHNRRLEELQLKETLYETKAQNVHAMTKLLVENNTRIEDNYLKFTVQRTESRDQLCKLQKIQADFDRAKRILRDLVGLPNLLIQPEPNLGIDATFEALAKTIDIEMRQLKNEVELQNAEIEGHNHSISDLTKKIMESAKAEENALSQQQKEVAKLQDMASRKSLLEERYKRLGTTSMAHDLGKDRHNAQQQSDRDITVSDRERERRRERSPSLVLVSTGQIKGRTNRPFRGQEMQLQDSISAPPLPPRLRRSSQPAIYGDEAKHSPPERSRQAGPWSMLSKGGTSSIKRKSSSLEEDLELHFRSGPSEVSEKTTRPRKAPRVSNPQLTDSGDDGEDESLSNSVGQHQARRADRAAPLEVRRATKISMTYDQLRNQDFPEWLPVEVKHSVLGQFDDWNDRNAGWQKVRVGNPDRCLSRKIRKLGTKGAQADAACEDCETDGHACVRYTGLGEITVVPLRQELRQGSKRDMGYWILQG